MCGNWEIQSLNEDLLVVMLKIMIASNKPAKS